MVEQSVLIALGLIFVLAILGVHVALAFLIASTIGLYLLFGSWDVTLALLEQTAFNGIRDYNLMVIPLFAIMGLLIAGSGAAADLFSAANRAFSKVPARLAVATVGGNALFAAVTGVGIAAAAAFSRIAYPPMRRAGDARSFAAGCIGGSSVLGLLIPPSVFMIVWAILTEQSVGRLFAAGVLPGLILAGMFMLYCMGRAVLTPQIVSEHDVDEAVDIRPPSRASIGVVGVMIIVAVTLGGIWFGFFTPTEGSAVGLFGGLILALAKGQRLGGIFQSFREAGQIVTPILLLIIGALMYSRLLALAGVPQLVGEIFQSYNLGVTGTILVMVAVWLVLGFFIDSISIMLLTVTLFWPIAQSLGVDPFVFAIVGILVIEAGVLTPPFGIGAFVVKGAVPDRTLKLSQIFAGLVPYWLMILAVAWLVYMFPAIPNWLPSLL